jgi:ATPase subunit of ABC transporter with duplicated ATPase domains
MASSRSQESPRCRSTQVIISHNNDFTTALCPETWVVEKDEDEISRPNCQGDPEWMKNALVC